MHLPITAGGDSISCNNNISSQPAEQSDIALGLKPPGSSCSVFSDEIRAIPTIQATSQNSSWGGRVSALPRGSATLPLHRSFPPLLCGKHDKDKRFIGFFLFFRSDSSSPALYRKFWILPSRISTANGYWSRRDVADLIKTFLVWTSRKFHEFHHYPSKSVTAFGCAAALERYWRR